MPLFSVTHGQCNARLAVTFPGAQHHRPRAGTKLHCLVTEAHECERFAHSCFLKAGVLLIAIQRPNHYFYLFILFILFIYLFIYLFIQ